VDNIGGLTDAIQSAAELIGEDSWTKCNLIPVNVGKTSWLNRFGKETGRVVELHLLLPDHRYPHVVVDVVAAAAVVNTMFLSQVYKHYMQPP